MKPPLVPRARAVMTRVGSIYWQVLQRSRAESVGLRILFYHRISDDRDVLAVTPRRFREHMSYLASEGYKVIDVVEAGELLARGELPPRVIALSFDDGYSDVADNAMPILEKHGFRATVFVVTGAMDGTATFPWYKRQPSLLSWTDVIHLDRHSPLRFEPHSVTHPNLLSLRDDDARREVSGCKKALEDRLGRSIVAFCYPGGLFGRRERELVAAAGYRMGVSCEPGVNLPAGDAFALRRIQIHPEDRLFDFRAKVRGGHDSPSFLRGVYRRVRYGSKIGGAE